MTKFADLHIHTYFSDSQLSPQQVVQEASQHEINCIAITDHDTFEGISPTQTAAKTFDVEVLPGIELSTEVNNSDIHILGYFLDGLSEEIQDKVYQFQEVRLLRVKKIIHKLTKLGINNITFEEVCALSQSNAVGRAHIARLLLEKGWVSNMYEAFNKFIGESCPAYVPKFKQSPQEAINLIHNSNGIAIFAHPMITNKDELIPHFVKAGLDGLEILYPYNSQSVVDYYLGIARKHNLVITGGSDAHGANKESTHIGFIKVPYKHVEELKARQRKYKH